MAVFGRMLGLVVLVAPLSGCATAALNAALRAAHPGPPWNGEVAITSEPPGARCTVERTDGRVLAEVAAAPGTVKLERSYNPLRVRCVQPGRLETVETLRPYDDAAVFRMAPNGVIGLTATIITAASARTMRYAGEVTLAMPPSTFPSQADLDAWFATRRQTIIAQRAEALALAEERCSANQETTCDGTAGILRTEQEADLAQLDAMRAQASIAPAVNAPESEVAAAAAEAALDGTAPAARVVD